MKNLTAPTADQLAAWNKQANVLRETILNTPNMEIPESAAVYYVSPDGDDASGGKSPETAWKTIQKVNDAPLNEGDYVCFERGGLWRGKFTAKPGVTYTAYGEGAKPRIYGSPFNGAKVGWEKVAENIWRCSEKFANDVGGISFNEGEAYGLKILVNYADDGTMSEQVAQTVFEGYTSLDEELEFWHDMGGPVASPEEPSYLYLYCSKGNPAEVYDDIEFFIRGNIISAKSGVTIDNLCIKYGGSHGIGAGTVTSLTVTNCEVGEIGGAIQFVRNGKITRFGNGVEIYGGCENYLIDHCYVYQCYDAGVTHQYSSGGTNDIIEKNVTYRSNLIEDCIYNIEYFLGKPDSSDTTRYMENILMTDNILLRAGYGWGAQRPDKTPDAHIKSWDHMNTLKGDFIIENNLMMYSNHMMLHLGVYDEKDLPIVRNNTFVQTMGGQFGRCAKVPTSMLMYTHEIANLPAFASNDFYVTPDKPE
ncbi:MAG: right-handed parallel beta-helix repeat-containing protein [Clostridia bacterium]|nr:right-handed parallel beta-helix repeat-containing protein [Clostridia bacterium]